MRNICGIIAVLSLLIFAQGICLGSLDQSATASAATHAGDPSAPNSTELQGILSDFQKYAEKGRVDWNVPGMAVVIVRGNDTIYMHAFGVKTLNGTDPVTNNTIFQIGSTSKAFTAALVAMQVDQGKIGWDDMVIDHLPDFRMYDPWVTREFTVTDLMAQRSGLAGYAGDEQSFLGYDRQRIMHSVRYIKPVTSFRSAYAYQNTMFLWAAALVENSTGKSWENNIKERIFQPLGMNNSTDDMASFQKARDVASLHIKLDGKVVALPMDWKYLDWVYIYGPAGGINSNIVDMAKWLRMQMNSGTFDGKQLINESSMSYMHSPKTIIGANPFIPGSNAYYCQGWIFEEYKPSPVVWHNGGTSGHHTMVAFMPQEKIGIVVLSNAGYTSLPEALAFKFFDMYNKNPERDWSAEYLAGMNETSAQANASMPIAPESPSSALPLANYTGNYSNEIFGHISITANSSRLMVTAGPNKMLMTLSHWNRDVFTASVPDFSDQAGFAAFQIDPEGRAKSVTMDMFEGATFDRSEK